MEAIIGAEKDFARDERARNLFTQALARDHDARVLGLRLLEFALDGGKILLVLWIFLQEGQEVGLILFQVPGDSRELIVVFAHLGQKVEVGHLVALDLGVLGNQYRVVHHVAGAGIEEPADNPNGRRREQPLRPDFDPDVMEAIIGAEKDFARDERALHEGRIMAPQFLERHPISTPLAAPA